MALHFIIGNSGSGKTEYLYRHIVAEAQENPGKNYLVLVPEQFTLQTQKKLVELSANRAIMNIDVLSFKRLAYRVFDELGTRTLRVLEETGKNLVLQAVAQQKKEELTTLRAHIDQMGYIGEVKSLISELMQYDISAGQLAEFLKRDGLPPILRAKLSDIAVLYEGFREFREERLLTAEELLQVLAGVAPDSALLRDCVLAFDEYTGFTPIQYRLLEHLMPLTEEVWMTLTADARENIAHRHGEHELFDLPKQTYAMLTQIADRCRIPVSDPVILGLTDKGRYRNAPELSFLEQNLFRTAEGRYRGRAERIEIHALKNLKEELIFVAREINTLIKEGYRYRDIAVVTGAVMSYQPYVDEIFDLYGIPYFLDAAREVLFHPFIEWIRASLDVLCYDFSYPSVMRFLRCGFGPLTEEETDRLDNYLLATGLRGAHAYRRRWLRVPSAMRQGSGSRGEEQITAELEELNEIRGKLWGVFAEMAEAGGSRRAEKPGGTAETENAEKSGDNAKGAKTGQRSRTVREWLTLLCRMMQRLGIEAGLREKAKRLREEGQEAHAGENEQLYRIVMQYFEKCVAILGDRQVGIGELSELLDAGLDALKVAVIPPGNDNVILGDIERTRLNEIKILFFIGVNDGVIPKSETKGGILSQYERELLKEQSLPLAPGAREQTFIQRYYLYLNMTKPSERLYVTYAHTDGDGKALRPSYLVRTLMGMFPGLAAAEHGGLRAQPCTASREAAVDYLIYGERDAHWHVLARYLTGEDEKIRSLLSAPFYHHEDVPISRVIAEELYGRKLSAGATRLERFGACAYSHFLQYGLRLAERDTGGFRGVDIGNLYHEALERYSRKLAQHPDDWFTVSEEERVRLSREAFAEASAQYRDIGIFDAASDRHLHARMAQIFEQTVWALTLQVRKGSFVPEQFEVSFREPPVSEKLTYALGGGCSLSLNGRIDRLDVCRRDGRSYVKVIDYKSGSAKFDLVKLREGLQLQLIVYLNAALARIGEPAAVPGAVLYYRIDDPVIDADDALTAEQVNKELLSLLRPDGLVNADPEVFRELDTDFTKRSDVIPVTLKADGTLSASGSHVADTEEFALLCAYTDDRIRRSAEEILAGDVRVNPYEYGAESACDYCPYRAVCARDVRIGGFAVRRLRAAKQEELLDRIRTELALMQKEEDAPAVPKP